MLLEKPVSQSQGAMHRRWFADEDFELIVWIGGGNDIQGFQLCYDRQGNERALTWTRSQGYFHNRVDDGEANPTKNRSPLLVADGAFDRDGIARAFRCESEGVPQTIRSFVLQKIECFPQ